MTLYEELDRLDSSELEQLAEMANGILICRRYDEMGELSPLLGGVHNG
jgi:hypothetical protein